MQLLSESFNKNESLKKWKLQKWKSIKNACFNFFFFFNGLNLSGGNKVVYYQQSNRCSMLETLVWRNCRFVGSPSIICQSPANQWSGREPHQVAKPSKQGPSPSEVPTLRVSPPGESRCSEKNRSRAAKVERSPGAATCLTLFPAGNVPPSPIPARLSDVPFAAVSHR